ncbi:MAG: hypothetical protein JEZ08_08845 [Clostridiales bacterium]|nr:hypothetical protein [Clostridiales bacterium]
MKKKGVILTGISVLIIGMIIVSVSFNIKSNDVATTIVTVDINPSVKIFLDKKEKVISAKAMNNDAETISYDHIIGIDVGEAIESIVLQAKVAGYIDEDDLEEDYVLITTVPMNNGRDKTDQVKEKINNRIAYSDELQSVNVAIIKASKVEMFEAEEKKVPVGLYVVNGKITVDGEEVPVKEFFSNSKNVDKFKEKGTITKMKAEKKREQLERYLLRLKQKGFDISPYQVAINATDSNLDKIISDIKKAVVESKKTNKGNSNNSNGKSKKK